MESVSAEVLEKMISELIPIDDVEIQSESSARAASFCPDFTAKLHFQGEELKIVIEVIRPKSSAVFKDKLLQIKAFSEKQHDSLPIVVSDYISKDRRELCRKAGVFFMDLSGNAFLQHKGLYIERIGFQNLFPEERKGRSPFSDKASLVLRALLENSERAWGIREIAQSLNIDAGFVSRVVQELEMRRYISRSDSKIMVRDIKSILDDWVHLYDYTKNREHRFFCLAESPDQIISEIKRIKIPKKVEYAFGLHAGANLVSPHVVFNQIHVYIRSSNEIEFFRRKLKLKEADTGANIIFWAPYYKNSVFYGTQEAEGLKVTSDLQLYLDLYNYPIRGLEHAEHIYEKRLG